MTNLVLGHKGLSTDFYYLLESLFVVPTFLLTEYHASDLLDSECSKFPATVTGPAWVTVQTNFNLNSWHRSSPQYWNNNEIVQYSTSFFDHSLQLLSYYIGVLDISIDIRNFRSSPAPSKPFKQLDISSLSPYIFAALLTDGLPVPSKWESRHCCSTTARLRLT